MISQDALYTWLGTLISTAGVGTPLKNATLFNSSRGSVDAATKVIRVDCFSGMLVLTTDTPCEEQDVQFVIECIITPDPETEMLSADQQLATAKSNALEMVKVIFRTMAATDIAGLGRAFGNEFDVGQPSFGSQSRGAAYFYGKVNP